MVTARTMTGSFFPGLAVWSTASTLMFLRSVCVTGRLLPFRRVARISTLLLGARKPATPMTSLTRKVTARILGSKTAARVLPLRCLATRPSSMISPGSNSCFAIRPSTLLTSSNAPFGTRWSGMGTALM